MRIDVRKHWNCIAWVGPHQECGHGLWLPREEFPQDDAWCAEMNRRYPGWKHTILECRGKPQEPFPEGWTMHPLYGDMQHGPLGL
jgi:hypothetical protein